MNLAAVVRVSLVSALAACSGARAAPPPPQDARVFAPAGCEFSARFPSIAEKAYDGPQHAMTRTPQGSTPFFQAECQAAPVGAAPTPGLEARLAAVRHRVAQSHPMGAVQSRTWRDGRGDWAEAWATYRLDDRADSPLETMHLYSVAGARSELTVVTVVERADQASAAELFVATIARREPRPAGADR